MDKRSDRSEKTESVAELGRSWSRDRLLPAAFGLTYKVARWLMYGFPYGRTYLDQANTCAHFATTMLCPRVSHTHITGPHALVHGYVYLNTSVR